MVTVAGVDHCPLGSCWTRAIVLPARGVPVEVALRVPERVKELPMAGMALDVLIERVVAWSVPTVTRRPALEAALEVSP